MRELKFRAWDKFQKRLIYIQGFIKDGNSIRIWYFNGNDDECILFNESFNVSEVIIEQYTGLKDKNGKEIYFDDVYYCHTFKRNSLVDERMFGLWIADMNDMNNPLSGVEIVGNIYENPELLK